jgi:protoporphyrinogen oxidase
MINSNSSKDAVVLGGGLAGLSAGHVLTMADWNLAVLESDHAVGGLSKTITYGDFRFDLGGHRFITKKESVRDFVQDLLENNFLTVRRKSKIYMHNRSFDYPLKPFNAVFGLGVAVTLKAISDYGWERVRNILSSPVCVSLEDWVVSNFGRTMFDLYFKDYSEKVWGIGCEKISMEWVSQRIRGLSLGAAIKNALFRFSGRDIDTLANKFIYPPSGIGYLSERLRELIEEKNPVLTGTAVRRIRHRDFTVTDVLAENGKGGLSIEARECISSIPVTTLVSILDPAPPEDILKAASRLRYRDLVIVTVLLDRESVTDLTWIYLPEKDITMGRIHEPKNWSLEMAPEGKTHLVCEYFCTRGDSIWSMDKETLGHMTVEQLEKLGFIKRSDVTDMCVLRVPKAYPLFEVGYTEHYNRIIRYLGRYSNLHIIGRNGMFRYHNMDYAMESGIETAKKIIRKEPVEIKERCFAGT